ncbi:MAG: Ig-like domain-containing protein, partial [Alphaproteobacteria bacterium]
MTDSTVQSSTVQSKPALQHPPVSAAAVEPVPTQLAQNAQPRLPAKSIAAVRPSAGDVATIELLAGHALKLHFELDEVAVRRLADGDLELLFGDGGKLVLRHYLQLADHGSQIAIPVLRKDGTPTDLTALVAPVASPENAGDEIADGGHFMSSYDAGALGEGIEHLAGLGDEDFSFAATAPIDRLQTNAFNRPPPPQPLAPSGPETGSNQLDVNAAPAARTDAATTDENVPVAIDVLPNDDDIDGDRPTVLAAGEGARGTTGVGTDGRIVYTPDRDFEGTDSFVYTITDGNGGTSTGTVNVTVNGVNVAPAAGNDEATTDENVPVTINVLSNDSDPDGDTPSVLAAGNGTNGTTGVGTDGQIVYTPNAEFEGTDSFVYTIVDGDGGTSTATVNVSVIGENEVPFAANDAATTDEDIAVTVDVLANDTDSDGGTLAILGAGDGLNGTTTFGTDGRIVYTPNAEFSGTDNFIYTITDGNGGMATATVNVTVLTVNDPPIAGNDAATTDEDAPVTVEILSNDGDIDGDPLTVASIGAAGNGSALLQSDGTVVYTPNAEFSGTDSFGYTIFDGDGGSASATATVTVNGVNDLPLAADDTASVNEDAPIGAPVNVLLNDTDADGNPLTVIAFGAAAHGSMFASGGHIIYTPEANFFGTDSFVYTISDGNGGTATATVVVTVLGLNDPPAPADDDATTMEDTPIAVNVLANDGDPDGDALTVTSAFGAAH